MIRNRIAKMNRTTQGCTHPSDWLFLIASLAIALVLSLPFSLCAQSSPLTVQPSTGRVGIGNTNPGHTLDINGTVNATGFIGDGSQLTNLPGAGGGTALNKVTANTTVVNTAPETNLYSYSVAGGTLGTNNVLRLTVQITDLDMGDGNNCVLRFKYGGTTFASLTVTNSTENPMTNEKMFITVVFAADGATNSQLASLFTRTTPNTSVSSYYIQGTAAVDSTAAQTLAITADWNLASNGNSITLGQAVLEKIS